MKVELLKTSLKVGRTVHFALASESLFVTQLVMNARTKRLKE